MLFRSRNLYFATQVIELGFPTVLALNMIDVAAENGHEIDVKQLSCALGVPVFPMTASTDAGVPELRRYLLATLPQSPKAPALSAPPARPATMPGSAVIHEPESADRLFSDLPEPFAKELARLANELDALNPGAPRRSRAEACLLISDERFLNSSPNHYPESIQQAITAARRQLDMSGTNKPTSPVDEKAPRLHDIDPRKVNYTPYAVGKTRDGLSELIVLPEDLKHLEKTSHGKPGRRKNTRSPNSG